MDKKKEADDSVTTVKEKGFLEKAWGSVTGSVKNAGKHVLKTGIKAAGIYGVERVAEHIYEDATGFDIQWHRPVSGSPIVTGVDTRVVRASSDYDGGMQRGQESVPANLRSYGIDEELGIGSAGETCDADREYVP